MPSWTDISRSYRRSRRQTLEPTTSAQTYRYVLTSLADHLDANEIPRGAGNGPAVVDAINAWMDARRWAASTRATNLGIVRPFLGWAARRGYTDAGIGDDIRNPRQPDPLPRALTVPQVNQLLSVIPDRRGRAVVMLEFQCGLRRAEVAKLEVVDLDLGGGAIRVHGKGQVERMVYPSAETIDALRSWMVERGPGPGAVICRADRVGARLTPTWIGMMVSAWLLAAGLKVSPGDGVSGHALRHTCATTMVQQGVKIPTIQKALGHRNVATTIRYLRTHDDEVADAMRGVSTNHRRMVAVEADTA